tara:strand:- start:1021 stop:1752 length:732 start_codon:yes stop_codon:yes gene_type:complete
MIEIAYAAETAKVDTGMWHAISSANIIVQLSLLTLVVMSVVTWAIIAQKRKQFRKVRQANEPFLDEFWRADSLDDIYEHISRYSDSPLANLFKDGYLELRKMADSNLAQKKGNDESGPLLTGIDNLERALRKATDSEIALLEHRLSFLATTGSSGPFIGLFGTVIGIMTAFQKIAQTGSANLAVVAPGISEALIATAVGLFAAIPASVFYNMYVANIRKLELDMQNFCADFLNIAKRNFFVDE